VDIRAERAEIVACEDLVMFINACLTCTGQREFYDDAYQQKVSIAFLHRYILGNYRSLYAQTPAAGINHFNQGEIILNLLATGALCLPDQRAQENALITAALKALPPQRAWWVLSELRRRSINNRRARALARAYIAGHGRQLAFQAAKYRRKLRIVASHAHLALPWLDGELKTFLYGPWPKHFGTELFEHFREARYSARALSKLPFTIAEGLAVRHNLDRARFLELMQDMMTAQEKLRLQESANEAETKITVDWRRVSLTKLVLYLLSKSPAERATEREVLETALDAATKSALRKAPFRLGKVAAVLDCSFSASGSGDKRRRPLALALAADRLLRAAASQYEAFWTSAMADPFLVTARGQTDLATPILAALASAPDLVVIVSDGWDNSPPEGARHVLDLYRTMLDPNRRVSIVHVNPVFNAGDYTLRRLSPLVPTVGLRDAEDLSTVLSFARFAEGAAPLAELSRFLAGRTAELTGAAP
jgi:hypothetical protein